MNNSCRINKEAPRNLFIDLIKSEQQTLGNGKLTHLAGSFNKLGSNLSGLNAAAQDAIIAQTLEWYYWNTAFQSATQRQFFKLDAANGLLQYTTAQGSGFAGAQNKANSDVSIWLNTLINPGAVQNSNGIAISYTGYQQWNVVGGTAGVMTEALDTSKGQVFVGNTGSDVFVGGNKSDLLIGADGDDTLQGKGGNDLLYGGTGDDRYEFSGVFGNDRIVDANGVGSMWVDGIKLTGGKKVRADLPGVWESADGKYRYTLSGTDLVTGGGSKAGVNDMQGSITVRGWTTANSLSITLQSTVAEAVVPDHIYNGDQHAAVDGNGIYQWANTSWAADGTLTNGACRLKQYVNYPEYRLKHTRNCYRKNNITSIFLKREIGYF